MAKVVVSHEACPWLMRHNVSRGAGVGGTGMAGYLTQGGMRTSGAAERLGTSLQWVVPLVPDSPVL